MSRKIFWLLITVIAVACIVLPAVTSAYNNLKSDNIGQTVDKQDIEETITEEINENITDE